MKFIHDNNDHRVFFTSDTHFGHKNIIDYCQRPFNNADEMDKALIENWNTKVRHTDTIFHLGDVMMKNKANRVEYLNQLNGKKYLIRGNHDYKVRQDIEGWVCVRDLLDIVVNDTAITLCHYKMEEWNNKMRGAIQLYGHTHAKTLGNGSQLDVGVDAWNMSPASFDDIMQRLETFKKR